MHRIPYWAARAARGGGWHGKPEEGRVRRETRRELTLGGRQLFLVPVSPQGQPADVRKARNRPGLLDHGGGWAHFSWLTWLARRRRARARLERREVCGLVG